MSTYGKMKERPIFPSSRQKKTVTNNTRSSNSSSVMRRQSGMLNSPIRWIGGKSLLRNRIISLLPQDACYVEVFGGAAWVLMGKQPSAVEVLNDIDGELINFFRVIKTKITEFAKSFEWELVSREEFDRLASMDAANLTDIERAHRFYYLIMASWGGDANNPRFQTSIVDGAHGNRLIGALEDLERRLRPIHERLRTVIIESLDWRECIKRYDSEKTVMYLDPPYPRNGAHYRHNMRSVAEHKELAERLRSVKCKWILSSYDTPEVRDIYGSSEYLTFPVRFHSGMEESYKGRDRIVNSEILIMNYKPSASPPIKVIPKDPVACVSVVASEAGLSKEGKEEETISLALKILRDRGVAHSLGEKDPMGLAAAALYIACISSSSSGRKPKKTQKELAKAAGVTEVTIRKRYKEMKLVIEEKGLINESAGNPSTHLSVITGLP
ncbi:MAG: DNA adenine methylase [Nitrososphaerales archaeon]